MPERTKREIRTSTLDDILADLRAGGLLVIHPDALGRLPAEAWMMLWLATDGGKRILKNEYADPSAMYAIPARMSAPPRLWPWGVAVS